MQQHSFLRGQTGEHLAIIPAMLCTPQVSVAAPLVHHF